MKRGQPLERRTPLKAKTELRANPDKVRAFNRRARENSTSSRKRQPISPASPAQRAAVKDRGCIVCAEVPVDPAHLLSRSVCPDQADDARAVVALCREHHRAYDLGEIGVLEFLEPYQRVELAFAVERFGLISTLEFVTKRRWQVVETP